MNTAASVPSPGSSRSAKPIGRSHSTHRNFTRVSSRAIKAAAARRRSAEAAASAEPPSVGRLQPRVEARPARAARARVARQPLAGVSREERASARRSSSTSGPPCSRRSPAAARRRRAPPRSPGARHGRTTSEGIVTTTAPARRGHELGERCEPLACRAAGRPAARRAHPTRRRDRNSRSMPVSSVPRQTKPAWAGSRQRSGAPSASSRSLDITRTPQAAIGGHDAGLAHLEPLRAGAQHAGRRGCRGGRRRARRPGGPPARGPRPAPPTRGSCRPRPCRSSPPRRDATEGSRDSTRARWAATCAGRVERSSASTSWYVRIRLTRPADVGLPGRSSRRRPRS